MLLYARQIDNAETLKSEVLATMKQYEADGGTANVKWWQRVERVEKYIQAEATVNKTGPLLLDLMVKFGMTPALIKPAIQQSEIKGGVTNDGGSGGTEAAEEVEDELAKLRAERGKHTRSG